MRTRYGRIHVMGGDGDGPTLYFGDKRGAPYISVDLRGFNGWTSTPRWLPGGWAFFKPTIWTGRLFQRPQGGRRWQADVLLPAVLVDFYRWKIKPSGRRYMREQGHDEPQPLS